VLRVIITIGLLGAIIACSNKSKGKDAVIVTVGSHSLHQSELSQLIHEGTSTQDSVAIIDGYVQSWIREKLMVMEAEKKVSSDLNINKLVDEYRSSLLVDNYEKKLVESQLDTVISENDLKSHYDQYKSQYILSQGIAKCIISKVSLKVQGTHALEKALDKNDKTEALFLVKEKSVFHHIDTARWLTKEDIKAMVPQGFAEKIDIESKRVQTYKDKEYQYFVKILRSYDESEVPPFSYISDKVAKVILSERKNTLLKQVRESLYSNAVKDKNISFNK
jgi:hypothetical protein